VHKTRNWRHFSVQNERKTLRPFRGQNSLWEGGGWSQRFHSLIFSIRVGAQVVYLERGCSTKRWLRSIFQHKTSTKLWRKFRSKIRIGGGQSNEPIPLRVYSYLSKNPIRCDMSCIWFPSTFEEICDRSSTEYFSKLKHYFRRPYKHRLPFTDVLWISVHYWKLCLYVPLMKIVT